MLAEESSDGVGRVKILPGDGSPSPRDGGACGSTAEGSSFLRCGGVRSIDGVRGSSTDGVRNWNMPCAVFLPLGREVRLATRGDSAPAMPYSEAGMLIGAVLVYDIESRDRDREGRWQWFGTRGPESGRG